MKKKRYSDETVHYTLGDLNEREKALYEEKLKADPDLAEDTDALNEIIYEVKLAVQLDEILNDPGYEEAEKMAEEAVNDYNRRKRREYLLSKKFRRNYIYPIAAGLFGLLYLGNIIYFMQNPELALKKYYKDYTPEYYADATIKQAQVIFTASIIEYSKGNYDVVAENMRNLMEEGELNIRGQVMLAFYDLWNTPPLQLFKVKSTEQHDALWQLAILAYKLRDFEKAQDLFSQIAAEDKGRAMKAKRMEREVRERLEGER